MEDYNFIILSFLLTLGFKGFQTIWALVWLGWWMVAFSYLYISFMKNLPKRNIPTQVKKEGKKGCVH
jgi:hypothetical protein